VQCAASVGRARPYARPHRSCPSRSTVVQDLEHCAADLGKLDSPGLRWFRCRRLGVKGSQVQILSARPKFSQVRGCFGRRWTSLERPLRLSASRSASLQACAVLRSHESPLRRPPGDLGRTMNPWSAESMPARPRAASSPRGSRSPRHYRHDNADRTATLVVDTVEPGVSESSTRRPRLRTAELRFRHRRVAPRERAIVPEAQLGRPGGATRPSRRRNSAVPEAQLEGTTSCGVT
jgi:hypothetical protein